jgi:hypothetical protein
MTLWKTTVSFQGHGGQSNKRPKLVLALSNSRRCNYGMHRKLLGVLKRQLMEEEKM